MAGWNSIGAYGAQDVEALREAAGITQFPSSTSFVHVMNGLQIQGGVTASIAIGGTLTVAFPAPYETQLLGVFLQPINTAANYGSIDSTGTDLTQFKVKNGIVAGSFYWWAIGV